MSLTYTLITSQTLSVAASSITFSAIPQTFTDLVLRYSVRDDVAGVSNGSNLITTNGSAQYARTDMRFLGSTPTGSRGTASSSFFANRNTINSAGNTANNFSEVEIYIPNYTLTVAKPLIGFATNPNNSTDCAFFATHIRQITTTPVINTISIAAGGNFIVGSSFYLYGIAKS
jgi:hypothetical protein